MSEESTLADRIAFHHEKMSENEKEIHDRMTAEAADIISRMTVPIEARLIGEGMRPALARSLSHTVLLDAARRVMVCAAKALGGWTREEWLAIMDEEWDRWDASFLDTPEPEPEPAPPPELMN